LIAKNKRLKMVFIHVSKRGGSGQSTSVVSDGLCDDGEALRIGIYITCLEAKNEGAGVVENLKTFVVISG
jgi:hypothetical protein